MAEQTLDPRMIAKMFLTGARHLEADRDHINELNVFPVPDGDTGTNMMLTVMSAAREVAALYMANDVDMKSLCKSISGGSLRGARGNSGVILSQLFRGFTKSVRDKDELNTQDLSEAFDKAVETAYKAVMKPKEGTILTVSRGVSEKASEIALSSGDDLRGFMAELVKAASDTLEKTPDMLPVLKQAGVVDSGGYGLLRFLEGALAGYDGEEIDLDFSEKTEEQASGEERPAEQKKESRLSHSFLYCTEFIIHQKDPFTINAEKDLRKYLSSMGESIALVADDDVVKVHLYTNDPGLVLQRGLKYGPLTNVAISNMDMEEVKKSFMEKGEDEGSEGSFSQGFEQSEFGEHKDAGFISVSIGSGLKELFKSIGCDAVIDGGQTMNPSTDDILSAARNINADTVYIFPNNKNIILAANQAASMIKDRNAVVIPTRTVAQGITAMLNYMPDSSAEDNTQSMIEVIATVRTGQVTYAVRDTVIDDREIKQGDYMGIGDHGLLSVGSSLEDTAFDMTVRMMDKGIELISIYYGEDVKEEDAKSLAQRIEKKYPTCDVELQYGGQPVYYYVISAE